MRRRHRVDNYDTDDDDDDYDDGDDDIDNNDNEDNDNELFMRMVCGINSSVRGHAQTRH